MKTLNIILVLVLLSFTSCVKDENQKASDDPYTFNMYFQLLKPDGTLFKEGEIEAKGGYLNETGEFVTNGEWYKLSVDPFISDILNKDVFGPFEVGVGWESNEEPRTGTQWVTNTLTLLRYEGLSAVDTLKVRDSMNYPEFRYFDVFKNGNFIHRFNDNDSDLPWHITIQK